MDEARGIRELRVEAGSRRAPRPPHVREWPIVGSTVSFLDDPTRYLLRCYRKHGPVFRIRLGPQLATVIAGLEGSAFVTHEGRRFVTSEGVWAASAEIMGADPQAAMHNVEGERHSQLRGAFRAGMSKSAATSTLERSLASAQASCERLVRSGEAAEAVELSRKLVFEQLGTAMAGTAPTAVFTAADEVLRAIVQRVRVPLLHLLPPGRSLKRATSVMRALGDELLGQSVADAPQFLKDVHAALGSGAFGTGDLPMILLTPFIAGLDTMAHSFAFVLYRLALHPEWRARLRLEVERAVQATGSLDADALSRCPELGYFVQEVMRIHPISPAVIRRAKTDFVLEGFRIDEGEMLLLPHTLPHFMEEHYPDPERFDPLRFHPDRAEHRGAHRFAPFGIGAHVCLGAGTAEVLLRANAAAFLHAGEPVAADPDYRLRVSNVSGACPVGFSVRMAGTAALAAA